MNNLEKAKQASLLATEIEQYKSDIDCIEIAMKNSHLTIRLVDGRSVTKLPCNKDLCDLLLLQAEGRLREKEIELDKLLNGTVTKLKSFLDEMEAK